MHEAVAWVVADRYEVGEVVGRGGYGMVRRGVDRKTGQPVALKMLSADSGSDPHVVERMLREQQAMLALAGTCAVTAIDLFRLPSGAPCLVMEWLDGCDLERQLCDWEADGQRAGLAQLLNIVRPLSETLQRAHDIGIVHRDIKPANVFLTPEGGVRLLDFGLSRMRTSAKLTAPGMVMGSPSYIAPETWGGNSALIDYRADLYSLAVIVFRALTGQVPFDTPKLLEKLELVTSAPRPSLCALRPDLAPAADDWMRRALAIDPSERFQSGAAFYEALAGALAGRAVPLAGDEVSGIRARADEASSAAEPMAPAETQTVLSLAWHKATALLRRFTGLRASDHPPREEAAKANPTEPPAATLVGAELAEGDRASLAWLDDSDVEYEPDSESVPAVAQSDAPAVVELAKGKRRGQAKPTTPRVKKGRASAAAANKKPKVSASKKQKLAEARKAGRPSKARVKVKKR